LLALNLSYWRDKDTDAYSCRKKHVESQHH
jgi:hypothetical protein